MSAGARITDEVNFFRKRGELRKAVRVVRTRSPERLRWRAAVSSVTASAAALQGVDRFRVEEPVRELVLDLDDRILRRETVLDARRYGIDLDRGEVMPARTGWDLKRTAYLTGVNHELVGRYLPLPADYSSPIDTSGVVVVARAIAAGHKSRSDRLVQRVSADGKEDLARHEQMMLERARHERDLARRWGALSKALIHGSR
ncbi:MAG: hypothetical protein OEZ06_19065 [Myxococcales bacterium]|nr:hypothetical protein [Myxococcales bacterium]